MQMANRYMKRCPMSLITREKEIETTMMSPHTSQNGYYQKTNKNKWILARIFRKGTLVHRW